MDDHIEWLLAHGRHAAARDEARANLSKLTRIQFKVLHHSLAPVPRSVLFLACSPPVICPLSPVPCPLPHMTESRE